MSASIEQFSAEWTAGAWGISRSIPGGSYCVFLHGAADTCVHAYGDTPRAAFDAAHVKYYMEYPTPADAKTKRAEALRAKLAELTEELAGLEVAA